MEKVEMVRVVMSFLGSLGFGMIFNMKKRHLLAAAAGGMFSWILYCIFEAYTGDLFLATLCASFFSVLYSEILARIRRCPANLYVIISLIPLFPGGSLYYMMSNAVQKQWEISKVYGSELMMYALGLAMGICLMSALLDLFHELYRRGKKWLLHINI